MMIAVNPKKLLPAIILISAVLIILSLIGSDRYYSVHTATTESEKVEKKYIKWVDMSIPYNVMESALEADIRSQSAEVKLSWIELMAYLAAKYGGNFKSYKKSDLGGLIEQLEGGKSMAEIAQDKKLYPYYLEAYTAIFAEFVGEHKVLTEQDGKKAWEDKYGLKVYSPVAKGYGFSHCDDFGNGRSFGYRRKHLGNDLMGGVGTPIIAIESGTIEAMGWNIYGGWRVGIRSFDKRRYYYYAHLRKDHPFHKELAEGQIVMAGDVIGYLGMTGYSRKENVNNINVPHLHLGLQLIFDESQKEGVNQIWIDVYNIVELLKKNKSAVVRNVQTKDFYRTGDIHDSSVPD
ncbi:MAG: M23 family metallopeptidase [Firmicutes bacterium]|nr:M23 family metallopeptidase [Bacillota bacterium]